jgi:hypothetical protein
MSATTADTASLAGLPEIGDLQPIERIKRRWPAVVGTVLTLAMVGFLGRELLGDGLDALWRTVPQNPLFYIAFAVLYMSPQTFDWIIFRRLWRLPISGLPALMKKRVVNDMLPVPYAGDASFYIWARERMQMVTAPFGAVKDVSILSAVAGNTITLIMLAIALPFGRELFTGEWWNRTLWATAGLVAMTVPFIIFSKRVFTLPAPRLRWIFTIHCTRLAFGSTMIAIVWSLALPGVPVSVWLLLATGRLIVSRLPIPTKDLLFATLAIQVIGQGQALSELVAFTAALTLLAHTVFIVGLEGWELLRRRA